MSIYRSFAGVLDYPGFELSERAGECASELATVLPRGAELLRQFQASYRELGTARLQEIYTSVFDMQPECALNLSYHLFGEDQRRGIFLAKLKELYEPAGISTGTELPDHLCLMLRYLATEVDVAAKADFIADCLHPAISKIARGLDATANAYRGVLDALLLWLEKDPGSQSPRKDTGVSGYEVTTQPS